MCQLDDIAHLTRENEMFRAAVPEFHQEIERLRAALKAVAENDYRELTPEDFARAALEQKP